MGNSIYEMIGYIIIAGFVGAILLGILIRLFEYFIIGIIFLIIVIASMFAIYIFRKVKKINNVKLVKK